MAIKPSLLIHEYNLIKMNDDDDDDEDDIMQTDAIMVELLKLIGA